ncbi:unnamed protein product [Closterium sp. NIES-53]
MRRCSGSGVRDTSADKLSACAIPCVFLGFVPDVSGWQFYHPTSRHVLPSQDVTFDESVPFYRLFPNRPAPSPPPPLFLAPGPPPVDPLPPQGPAPSGVSQVDPLPGTTPLQVAVVSGVASGAASGVAEPGGAGSKGAASGGVEPEGVEHGGAESEGADPEGAESEGAESGGAEPRGTASSGGPAGASQRLSSQQLREWLVQRAHRWSGAPGAGEPRGARAGGAAVTTRVGDPTEPGAAGTGGAGAGVAGVGGPCPGGAGGAGARAIDPGAGGAGGTMRPRPYFVPLLQQPPTEQSGGLTERREPASRPVSPVRTARRAPRSRPPPVPGTHTMALRPSSVPLRVPLPSPPESSLPAVPDPESDRARAPSPTVARLLATAVTDPSFESAAASALVAKLLDFAAACRLNYASALVAESVPARPPSVGADPSLFLRTDNSLPPFYVLVYVDDLVFATADTKALTLVKSFSALVSSTPRHSSLLCLPATCTQLHLRTSPTSGMGLVLGGRGLVVLTVHADASWVDDSAKQRSSQGYTFSLGSGSVSWRSTRSYSVLSSSCEAEIYAGAMAAQELRWLTYLLIDLGEQPRLPPVLYVDNKAIIALSYVATRANTADVFTKALPLGDHQRFVTVLGLLALLCFFS